MAGFGLKQKASRASVMLDRIERMVEWDALVEIVAGLDKTREGKRGRAAGRL